MLHAQNAEALSVESTIAHIWSMVLGSQPANPETSLFDAGGNSLAAAKLMIQERTRSEKMPFRQRKFMLAQPLRISWRRY